MAFLVKAFLTLFVVIDPIGLLPIFITLAGKYPAAQQIRIAQRAVLVAGVILLVFALVGNWLCSTLPTVRSRQSNYRWFDKALFYRGW